MASDPATAGRSGRPLSPHLQIWRFTPTMAASITGRITGAALYAGTVLLALWCVAAAASPEAYALFASLMNAFPGRVVLFGYAWAILFHTLNGLRHLYWDAGRGLEFKTATMTAWLAFGASFLLAALIFAAGISA